MSASLVRLMTVTASTKRSPAISGGKRGAMVTNLASITVTPLDPVDPEIRERMQLDTPHEVLTCLTNETDIVEGDVLVVGTTEYPIRAVADWNGNRVGCEAFVQLYLEDLKR